MARHSIVEKLEPELRKSIESEVQVVYILVELRKLLEHDNKKDAYPVVNFYCNWVVHTKLDKSVIAEKIIRYMDGIYDHFDKETQTFRAPDELRALLDQSSLRNQLQQCLEYYILPVDICSEQSRWLKFSAKVCSVIEDCPLLIQSDSKKAPTQFVQSVSVFKLPGNPEEDIGMKWQIKFHTNPTVRVKDGNISVVERPRSY